jgi:hypothetical protein
MMLLRLRVPHAELVGEAEAATPHMCSEPQSSAAGIAIIGGPCPK